MATVLIADDSPCHIDLLVQALRRAGHFLLCARDGDKAWQLMQQFHIDLLITARCLPGLSGDALVRRLRCLPRFATLPVIMTGTSEPVELDALWIAKPLQIAPHVEELLRPTADRQGIAGGRVG